MDALSLIYVVLPENITYLTHKTSRMLPKSSLAGEGNILVPSGAGDDIIRYEALGPVLWAGSGGVHGSVHRAGSWAREISRCPYGSGYPLIVCVLYAVQKKVIGC